MGRQWGRQLVEGDTTTGPAAMESQVWLEEGGHQYYTEAFGLYAFKDDASGKVSEQGTVHLTLTTWFWPPHALLLWGNGASSPELRKLQYYLELPSHFPVPESDRAPGPSQQVCSVGEESKTHGDEVTCHRSASATGNLSPPLNFVLLLLYLTNIMKILWKCFKIIKQEKGIPWEALAACAICTQQMQWGFRIPRVPIIQFSALKLNDFLNY